MAKVKPGKSVKTAKNKVKKRVTFQAEKNSTMKQPTGKVDSSSKAEVAEEKVLLAKDEWERTFDSMPDLVAILDNEHRIVRVNKSMAQRLGMASDGCVGLNCFKCVHKLDAPPEFCPHSRTLRDGKEHIVEIHEDNLNGDFMVSTTPLFDQQGQIIGSVHVARDITERKKAEEALKRLNEELEERVRKRTEEVSGERKRFIDLLEQLPAYLVLLTPDHHVSYANKFFRERFGEDRGRRCFEYLFGRTEPCENCETYKVLDNMTPREWEWAGPDGHNYHIYDAPFAGRDGSTLIMEVGIDITERKKAEAEVRIRADQQSVVAQLGQMASGGCDLDELFSEAVKRVAQTLNVEFFKVLELLPGENELLLRAGVGWKEGLVGHATVGAGTDSQAGYTLLSKEPVIVEDLGTETRFSGPQLLHEHKVVSGISVIIYGENKPFGVLGAHTTKRRTFTKDDVNFLQTMANVLTNAIEHKKTEEKMRTASLYSRSLIEASLDPLVTISADGKITDVNKATEDVTGVPREQLIGSDFSDYFTEPDKARAGYQQVFQNSYVKDYPLTIRHKSGRSTEVLYNATVYRNEAGGIQGIFAAARDVTERKQAEEMLRTASLYSRSLIEASLDPLVTISAEGKITDVNKATEDVTGFSREELIGSDFSTYFTEPEKAREGYQQVFTEGYVRDYLLAIRHKLGKITDVLYNATVYRNEKGEIQGVFAAARDITEREQAENRIKEQAELLNQAHDAITVRDLNNRILYWNKGAQRLYGWTEEEAVGKDAGELLFKEKPSLVEEPLKIVLEKGEWSGEFTQITKDGKNIIIETHWTLMRDNEGNPKSILAINTDITDKKNLETQMLRAQRMESVGTLASGIAHDLNNVLTPIMLSLQLLQTEVKEEESKKTLDILEKSARRGADLVKQVLTFARGVAGERKPIKVAHLVGEVERIITETFPKSIEIRTTVSPDLWTVSGDATQLHQVIMNLCLNARDAMPDGGTLSISADNVYVDEAYSRMHIDAKIGNYIIIAVTDNGVGIPPELRDKIFEPFFTTKERGKGTGLGLSTSLAIVKSHGGFINLYSEFRKGSTFKVYLPIVAGEVEKIEVKTTKDLGGKGELVLVVEDEASICEITRAILESNGYRVMIANDGAEAVALYSKNKEDISIVLMDMAMPVMDGYMSIRALLRIDPQTKIIAVSGLTENGKVATLAGTVKAFLAKPYSSERLLKTIGDVLHSK